MPKFKYYYEPTKYVWVESDDAEFIAKHQDFQRAEWRRDKREQGERNTTLSLNALLDDGAQIAESEGLDEQYIADEEQTERDGLVKVLLAVLPTLQPEQQKIVRMKFYEGKNETEIGRLLGITKQSVQDRIKVILKKLKKLLQK